MNIVELPINRVTPAIWNANEMTPEMQEHLKCSIKRFGLLVPLVVRRIHPDYYETIGGAQRLAVIHELGVTTVPCIIVELIDSEARLLSQALNRIAGSDNLGLRAEQLENVLSEIPEAEVLNILPETGTSLRDLVSMSLETMAGNLQKWQQEQAIKLKHAQFQVTGKQMEVVNQALDMAKEIDAVAGDNPNKKGNYLYLICKYFVEGMSKDGK